jgi:dihydrofolate reductase
MATIYYTAATLDGFIATLDHSLAWLVTRDHDPAGPMGFEEFRSGVGAAAWGANTYQWLLDNAPDDWDSGLPSWVFTHREFAARAGVRFTYAAAADVHGELVEAAGGKDVWVVGGGGLAGQFADAGLLDEVIVTIAPVTLGAGAPLLPTHVELRLEEVDRNREFACLRYAVVR